MIGERFGTLTVVSELPERNKYRYKMYVCRCDCGGERITSSSCLRNGSTTGCGNHRPKKENAVKRHALYRTYQGMLARCYNEKHKYYAYYGGRGISVCPKWIGSFYQFVNDMGERPEGLTLDRIDNDKGYSKENCKWSTMKEQSNNRRPNSGWKVRRKD